MKWPFSSGQRAFVVVDAALPGLRAKWYELAGTSDSIPLYNGTPFAHLLEVSPILAEINPDHKFLGWAHQSSPSNNWGVLLTADANLAELAAHLRKSLTLVDENDSEVLCRFYDPDILPVFWQSLSVSEQQIFAGPVTQWAARQLGEEACWLSEPVERGAQSTWQRLKPLWLRLTEQHIQAMRPIYHRHRVQQAVVQLNQSMTWRLMHLANEIVVQRIDETVQAIYRWHEAPSPQETLAFCQLCLERCSHFYRAARAEELLASADLAQALVDIERDLAEQPDHYAPHHDPDWMPSYDETALISKRREQRWSDQG